MKLSAALLALFLVLSAAVIGARQQDAQQQRPALRTGVQTVVVDVSVMDRDHKPLKNLTAADFTILEDGKPQQVSNFTTVDLDDSNRQFAAWMREVPPDVRRNDETANGRIMVLVLDDATPTPATDMPRAKEMAKSVINQMGPSDFAAVLYVLNKKNSQDLTQDRARLLAAVEKFTGNMTTDADMSTTSTTASNLASRSTAPAPLSDLLNRIRYDEFDKSAITLYQATIGALKQTADYLADLHNRRKALVFVSIGLPLDASITQPRQNLSGGDNSGEVSRKLYDQMIEVFAAAQRANVNIYSMDPASLRASMPMTSSSGQARDVGQINHDFLQSVSTNTGGFLISSGDRLEESVPGLLRENGSYYLLGYQSTNERSAGRFRRIEVQVNRPGVTIHARTGYYEPRGDAAVTETTSTGASGLVPKTDMQLRVTAAPFVETGKKDPAVAIVLGLNQPAYSEADAGKGPDTVEIVVAAYDNTGTSRGVEQVKMKVDANAQAKQATAYEFLSRLSLPPGRYQLRLAANSTLQAKTGTIHYDLDVPDFSKSPISLSGAVVSVDPGPASVPKDRLVALVPVTPTAQREFRKNDVVTAFMRIYQDGKDAPESVNVVARVVDAGGNTAFEIQRTFEADEFSKERAADCHLQIPVSQLQPGPHMFTLEAKVNKGTARRDVRFTIVK